MEKFYFEVPSMNRKNDAIAFINEFYEFNSDINGTSGLQRFLDNYEGWLDKLQEDYTRIANEEIAFMLIVQLLISYMNKNNIKTIVSNL